MCLKHNIIDELISKICITATIFSPKFRQFCELTGIFLIDQISLYMYVSSKNYPYPWREGFLFWVPFPTSLKKSGFIHCNLHECTLSPTTYMYPSHSLGISSDLPRVEYCIRIFCGTTQQIKWWKKPTSDLKLIELPWDDRPLCLCWGGHHPLKLDEEAQSPSWFQHLLVEVSFPFPAKKEKTVSSQPMS